MLDIALTLIVPAILGFIIGQNLDKHFGHKFPIWTMLLSLFGLITGFWSVYKRYK